jgi:hypothetical protein
MKYLMMLITILQLTGCVSATGLPNLMISDQPDVIKENTSKLFVGVPALLALEGSSVRINQDWLVTAAHNKPILSMLGKEVVYHPTCDIALIKESGEGGVDLGLVYDGDEIKASGYPTMLSLAINSGKVLGGIKLPDFKYGEECVYIAFDAANISGMSGGGVFNESNQLVGTISSNGKLSDGSRVSFATPIVFVSDWIKSNTGVTIK